MSRFAIALAVIGLVGCALAQDLLNSDGNTIYNTFEGGRHPHLYSSVIWLETQGTAADPTVHFTGTTDGAISATAEVYWAIGKGIHYHSTLWIGIQ